MSEEIKTLIKKYSPLLEEDSDVFRELETFFSKSATIEMHHGDLSKFLKDNRTYQVVRVSGKSYKDCVYELVDNFPEMMDAIGMLRYYKAPTGNIQWEEIEAATTIIDVSVSIVEPFNTIPFFRESTLSITTPGSVSCR